MFLIILFLSSFFLYCHSDCYLSKFKDP